MWALAECDVAHKRVDAGWTYGQTDTSDFRAMAPLGRVPVWQEESLSLWESHVILRHLGRGPCAKLWPKSSTEQARTDLCMEFTTTTLQPPFIGVFFQTVRLDVQVRSAEKLRMHLAALDTALDIVEATLDRTPYLAGHALGLGDIAMGSLMYRYFDLDIARSHRPALVDWYVRLQARPAYQKTVMTSYEELRAT